MRTGAQAAGTLPDRVLRKIIDIVPTPLRRSVETGCGKSTILLSHLAEHHLCFTFNDAVWPGLGDKRCSLDFVRECNLFHKDRTEFILGPSQRTLPIYTFSNPIDFALIDGAHAFPFPDLDYYYLHPHLRPGAVLVLDDINIATIGQMADVLAEDDMFEKVHVEANTAFFLRTDARTFDPEGDGWWTQKFNINRMSQQRSRPIAFSRLLGALNRAVGGIRTIANRNK